jgi:hypothetical protein
VIRFNRSKPRLVMAVTGCVAAALVFGATALAATPSQTTGSAAYTAAAKGKTAGATVSVQVSAYQYADGSFKGQQQYTSTGVPGDWHGGTPTCYNLVTPNMSIFGGPITSSNSDPALVGQFYVIEVIQSTTAGVPDQIGVQITKTAPTCQKFRGTLNNVTQGSLTVH